MTQERKLEQRHEASNGFEQHNVDPYHELVQRRVKDHLSHGGQMPLHYRLYTEIQGNNGELPRHYREALPHIDDEREKMIPHLVRDVCVGIAQLEEAGYSVIYDPKEQIQGPGMRELVAKQMAHTIRQTYPHPHEEGDTVYPLKESRYKETAKGMETGSQDAYMVYDPNGEPVATFGIVRKQNVLGSPYLAELGRTGINYTKMKDLREKGLGLRAVSELRLLHMIMDNRYGNSGINAFFSDIRCTSEVRRLDYSDEIIPDGQKVQGTFFGGLKQGIDLGWGIWGIGNQYALGSRTDNTGGLEPFLRVGQWRDSEKLNRDLHDKMIVVPNPAAESIVSSLMATMTSEPVNIVFTDNVTNIPTFDGGSTSIQKFDPDVILTTNGDKIFSTIDVVDTRQDIKQLITGVVPEDSVMPLSQAITRAKEVGAPYIEFYVEATVNSSELNDPSDELLRVAGVMNKLVGDEIQAVVTGITPSDKGNGGIRLTFSLILDNGFKHGVIEPTFPEKYYKGTRLEDPIRSVQYARRNLIDHSLRSPVNNQKQPVNV